jgi:hypothetical protein
MTPVVIVGFRAQMTHVLYEESQMALVIFAEATDGSCFTKCQR